LGIIDRKEKEDLLEERIQAPKCKSFSAKGLLAERGGKEQTGMPKGKTLKAFKNKFRYEDLDGTIGRGGRNNFGPRVRKTSLNRWREKIFRQAGCQECSSARGRPLRKGWGGDCSKEDGV